MRLRARLAGPAAILGIAVAGVRAGDAPCGTVQVKAIDCHLDKSGFGDDYDVTVTVTNTSGVPVAYLLFPGTGVAPPIVPLVPPLPDGGSVVLPLLLVDLAPGALHCLPVIMADAQVEACCHAELCVETPECDCLRFEAVESGCDDAGDVVLSFTYTNLAPFAAAHMFLIPESPAGATIAPNHVLLPPVPPYGVHTVGPFVLSGTGGAGEACIRVTIHAEDLELCCAEVLCFDLPDCGPPPDPCDLDGDGVVDFADLLVLLGAWGPCPPPPCPADLDHDGDVDFDDLLILLGCWTI